jgi:hypothetical protein
MSDCLHCGRKLGFLKRFGTHRFCCDEHEFIHQRESNELLVGRLLKSALLADCQIPADLPTVPSGAPPVVVPRLLLTTAPETEKVL